MYSTWNLPKYMIHMETRIQNHGPGCASAHMAELKSAIAVAAQAHRKHNDGGKFATYTTVIGDIDLVHQFAPVHALTDPGLMRALRDPGSHATIREVLEAGELAAHAHKNWSFNVSESFNLLMMVPKLSNLPAAGAAPKGLLAHIIIKTLPGTSDLVAATMEQVAAAHKSHETGAFYATYRTVVGDVNEIHHFSEIENLEAMEMAFEDPGSRKLSTLVHGQDKSCHNESVRGFITSERLAILRLETELSNI